jgi:CubicO group peptidase (beta-lactamase class C family)
MLDEVLLRRSFEEAVKRSGAVGAQLSIVKGSHQVDFATGLAHAQRDLAMTIETLMQVGSIGKVFNAAVLLSLVEDGLLDLDTPVRDYAPELEVLDPKTNRSLTLRNLASMSSGLDNGPYIYFGGEESALAKYVTKLPSLPQHFPPGQGFGYSNAGVCVAGYVASKVSGKSWEALVRERILHASGLTRSAMLEADVLYQTVSAGHLALGNRGRYEIIDPVFTMARARAPSSSTLAMSTSHLARFGKMFIDKGIGDSGARVLSESSVAQMMRAQTEVPTRKYCTHWCIGPHMGNWNGVKVWGHGGTSLTSTAFLYWIPEHKGVIAFNINTHAAMSEFSEAAFGEVLEGAFGFRKPRIDVPDSLLAPLDHRRYLGSYEELGMRLDVTRDGSTLRGRFSRRPIENERLTRTEQTVILEPLSADRFVIRPPNGPDKHRGVVDMAFFGDDGTGRATNAVNIVFPMSRVSDL